MNRTRVRTIRRPDNSAETQQAEDYTSFWDHRKRLQDLIERMELEYDKALLVLHPLGITASSALYNQMVGLKLQIRSVWPLYVVWGAFGLGTFLTLASFRTSICANARALEKHDTGEESDHKAGIFQGLTMIFNWSSGILFVTGVILAALFLSRTL